MAGRIKLVPPTAKIDSIRTSAFGHFAHDLTASEREASIYGSSPNLLAIVSLWGYKSEVTTVAPARRAKRPK